METLTQLRNKINKVDEEILRLIGERVKICKSIGATKRRMQLSIKDEDRENEVLERVKQKAQVLQLDSLQISAIYREIVNMCSSVQE